MDDPHDPLTKLAADVNAAIERLSARIDEAVTRVETSRMDESERAAHEAARRTEALVAERDRLLAGAREWERRYRDTRVRQLLADAAAECGAYRPEQVVALLAPRVEWPGEGTSPELALAGPTGPARYDESRFAEAVRAYLAENPNLAKSASSGGAGSAGSPSPAPAPRMTKLAELRRRRAELESAARGEG
ncbi:MAG: hypothetical protein KJ042_13450 [Deltaproteobacteria bacterium]|nr:hypothetical protein [Deltaproteobacteria bacterium]